MQCATAATGLKGGLIALPISSKPSARRPRICLVSAAKKASTPAPVAPEPAADVPSYFLPDAVEAGSAPGSPEQQQQLYQGVPQYPVAPPPAPAKPTGFWSSVPPLVWIGVGILTANVVNTALQFVRGGPQKMQEMAMQTMMNQMMKQAMKGAPPGAANPFAAGGFPGAAGGAAANPFGAAFPSGFPSAGAATASPAASQPPIDTTASPASSATSSTTSASPAAASTTSSSTAAADKPKKKSAFKDVDASAAPSSSTSTSNGAATESTTTSSSASAAAFTPPPFPPPPTGGAGAAAATGESAGSMLDMLRNPEMQKMLYPYLPEPMRNPETFEWMLNSPEYRAQLEGMLSQQMGGNAPTAVQDLMKDVDMSPEKMKEQFDALGMTPDQFVGKVMSDPQLAAAMTKPAVMEAIAECTKNPMSIFKYQNDKEVMMVFEKLSGMFPQAAGAGALPAMPGMPTPPAQQ